MPKLGSLRSKMLLLILTPVAAAIVLLTVLAISRSSSEEKKAVYGELQQRTSVEALKVDKATSGAVVVANSTATILGTADSRSSATAGLSALLAQNTGVANSVYSELAPGAFPPQADKANDKAGNYEPSISVGTDGGIAVATSATGAKEAAAAEAGATGVNEPTLYQGTWYVATSQKIMRGGKVVGVAGTASTLSAVDKSISSTHLLKTGYAFAVSKKGILLASPQKAKNGKVSIAQLADQTHSPSLKRVADSIANGRSGQLETTDPFTGKKIVLSWARVGSAGWTYLTAAPVSEVLAPVNSLRTTLLIVGLILFGLVSLSILWVATRLTKPIQIITDAAERLADGDVDINVDIKSNDEVGRLGASFQRTIEYLREKADVAEKVAGGDLTVDVTPRSERDLLGNAFTKLVADLRGIVSRVAATANGVSDASRQMAGTSDEAGRAIQEIATAIGEVAEGTNVQVQKVEAVREAAERAAETARQSAGRAHEAAETAAAAKTMASDGLVAADEASAAMRGLAESSAGVTGAIETLAAKSERIGGIVDTITGIAEQTNLLALNAAIEAARAGEQGRGFAVVAEEVRKLAEESQSAAGEIAGLIGEIQRETGEVVDMVADTAARTEGGTVTVERARSAFEAIGTAVEDVSGRAAEIAGAIERLSVDADQMASDVVGVATVAESASASSQQVSASTEQTSASTQEIAASAQELASSAEELEKLVATFQLG
jgi:methyl-accepting chemotaxis protein